MTTVVRIRRKDGKVVQWCDVYIGRVQTQGGWNLAASVWANPYHVKECKTVAEACALYEKYIRGKPDLMRKLPELDGKSLGCWCERKKHCSTCGKACATCGHPQCHGDILVKLIAETKKKSAPKRPPPPVVLKFTIADDDELWEVLGI